MWWASVLFLTSAHQFFKYTLPNEFRKKPPQTGKQRKLQVVLSIISWVSDLWLLLLSTPRLAISEHTWLESICLHLPYPISRIKTCNPDTKQCINLLDLHLSFLISTVFSELSVVVQDWVLMRWMRPKFPWKCLVNFPLTWISLGSVSFWGTFYICIYFLFFYKIVPVHNILTEHLIENNVLVWIFQ